MTDKDQTSVNANDTGDRTPTPTTPPAPVDTGGQTIPKHRFDAVNEKRKAAEQALETMATSIIDAQVPENFRSLVPDLPPAQKIQWVNHALAAGIFASATKPSGPDTKRPNDKAPESFEGLSPQAKMSHGYKTK